MRKFQSNLINLLVYIYIFIINIIWQLKCLFVGLNAGGWSVIYVKLYDVRIKSAFTRGQRKSDDAMYERCTREYNKPNDVK